MTERLVLRDLTADDLEAVHAYASDPEVCRYMTWGPNTVEQTRDFIAEMVASAEDDRRQSFTWAITAGGAVLGACSVAVTSVEHRRGELGYVVARSAWGQGYATEAALAVLRFAHEQLRLERVEATCRPENNASRRVLSKIGLRQEGLLRSHMIIRGRREDSLLFASIR
jgi:ribosomal-protein-alanine N-acetyltransferase